MKKVLIIIIGSVLSIYLLDINFNKIFEEPNNFCSVLLIFLFAILSLIGIFNN